MPDIYEWTGVALAVGVLAGIRLMNQPETAAIGNRLSALCLLAAIVMVLWRNGALTAPVVLAALVAGTLVGLILALRVTMLQMPQLVALLNGLGGAASLLTAFVAAVDGGMAPGLAGRIPAALAVAVGGVTLSGSLVAAGKLHRLLPQDRSAFEHRIILPCCWPFDAPCWRTPDHSSPCLEYRVAHWRFRSLRIAWAAPHADHHIPPQLDVRLAASFADFRGRRSSCAGPSWARRLILTRDMCAAMNRPLRNVLTGAIAVPAEPVTGTIESPSRDDGAALGGRPQEKAFEPVEALLQAQSVVVIPGYGMALGEAETQVRALYELLVSLDKDVTLAIKPVAGSMPGHMTVLMADVDIPYDRCPAIYQPPFAQTTWPSWSARAMW